MKPKWKDPKDQLPQIPKDKGSVCIMVTPGDWLAQYPMKAWYSGGIFWLCSGEPAVVSGWDYYPGHPYAEII